MRDTSTVAREQRIAAQGMMDRAGDPELKKRRKRLRAVLAAQGLSGALEQVSGLESALVADTPVEGNADLGQALVKFRRQMDTPGRLDILDPQQAQQRMARTASRPMGDVGWDRLFGALKMRELQALTQGKSFGIDYGGFGNTATETYSPPGFEYNPMREEFTATGRNIRQRILDPRAQAAARAIGKMQMQRRR